MVEDTFDYAIGNPPFSITLTDRARKYRNTNWQGNIPSHLAWLELAVRSIRPGGFVAAVLPKEVLRASDTISFHRWLNTEAREVARVHLPPETFEATDWPCILVVYEKQRERGNLERFEFVLPKLGVTAGLIASWRHHVKRHSEIGVARYAETVQRRSSPIPLATSAALERTAAPTAKSALAIESVPEVRLLPRERLGMKPSGLLAALVLEELRLTAPVRFERKRKVEVNTWDELRRKPFLLHGAALLGKLVGAGLGLWIDAADDRSLRRRRRWLERETTPFERFVREAGEWKQIYVEGGLKSRYRATYDAWRKRAIALGLDRQLYPFQLDDVCRIAMKTSALLCLQQGLGKTRVAIAAQVLVGSKRGLYVVPSKLIGEWENEFHSLGLKVHVIDGYEATKHIGQFNLVAYEALWRVPRDSPLRDHAGARADVESPDGDAGNDGDDDGASGDRPSRRHLTHTLAALLRRRFSYVVLDEAYYIKNPDALRSRAVYHLQAKRKVAMTGTPIKGYPQNILGLLNWTFGSGSSRLPDYSYHEEGGVKRFLESFGTYVYYDEQHAARGDQGKKKQIPKIKNVPAFYDLLASKMIRRVKNEPEVATAITTSDPLCEYVRLPLEDDHRRFYDAWLKDFIRWYEARLAAENLGGKRIGKMEILAKLGYLIQAATIPQSGNLTGAQSFIAPYAGGPTALQAWVVLRVREAALAGEKVIVFSRFIESLAYLARQLRELQPTVVTGSVSLERKKRSGKSERQEVIEAFRRSTMPVLLAGTACLSEGMNIPEASVGIFCDYDWTPSVMFQALYRMVRPQQRRQVRGYFCTVTGTVMDYMQTLCELKQKAIDEGIDHQENDFKIEDVPDIEQYCRAIVEAGAHVPEKRAMRLGPDDEGPEEESDDLDLGEGPGPDAHCPI